MTKRRVLEVRRRLQRRQQRRLAPLVQFRPWQHGRLRQVCEVLVLVGSQTPGSRLRASAYEERGRIGCETSGAREREDVGVRAVY